MTVLANVGDVSSLIATAMRGGRSSPCGEARPRIRSPIRARRAPRKPRVLSTGSAGLAPLPSDPSVLPLKFDAEYLAVQDRGDAIDSSPRYRPNCVMCLRDGTLAGRTGCGQGRCRRPRLIDTPRGSASRPAAKARANIQSRERTRLQLANSAKRHKHSDHCQYKRQNRPGRRLKILRLPSYFFQLSF